jgi:hypothetical protein
MSFSLFNLNPSILDGRMLQPDMRDLGPDCLGTKCAKPRVWSF